MFEFYHFVVIPIIIGIVEVIKKAGFPVRFSPLVSLALGLFFGFVFQDTFKESLIIGLITGLSATGLYSGSKNLCQSGNRENK
nr:hypothetical protein [uncultured Bacillus sp.]